MTRIISYNVNGIRAASRKGLLDWIKENDSDIIGFQEIKARPVDLDKKLLEPEGYHAYWYPAEKKGYSGVAVYSKKEPIHVEYGCGIEKYDREGRIIRVDYEDLSFMNVYIPSGSSGDERQGFKDVFLEDFFAYVEELKKTIPNLVISGDYNIVHKPIDIHNPTSNKNTSGFLPHEREWVSNFLEMGFRDSFREVNPDPHHYTWWTYRAGARGNNKGWRIDYHMITEPLFERLEGHVIHADIVHSDHCPIELILKD